MPVSCPAGHAWGAFLQAACSQSMIAANAIRIPPVRRPTARCTSGRVSRASRELRGAHEPDLPGDVDGDEDGREDRHLRRHVAPADREEIRVEREKQHDHLGIEHIAENRVAAGPAGADPRRVADAQRAPATESPQAEPSEVGRAGDGESLEQRGRRRDQRRYAGRRERRMHDQPDLHPGHRREAGRRPGGERVTEDEHRIRAGRHGDRSGRDGEGAERGQVDWHGGLDRSRALALGLRPERDDEPFAEEIDAAGACPAALAAPSRGVGDQSVRGPTIASGRTNRSNCSGSTSPSLAAASFSVEPSACAFLAIFAALS